MNHILGSWCSHNKYSKCPPLTWTQASAPLVDGIINHVLLQSGPALNQSLSFTSFTFFLVDPILHRSPNLAIYWVEICTIRRPDKVRWMQASPVDCLACPVRRWFANINISQGSVATHLRWDGIFINHFIANFQLSTSVKELWKSVNI